MNAPLLNLAPRLVIQGITGHQGSINTQAMLEFGTQVLAGVTPEKEGANVAGVPVYNSVSKAVSVHDVDTSILFVPARNLLGAALEALDAGIRHLVVVTEHVPLNDTIRLCRSVETHDATLLGPNCPGYAVMPGVKVGIIPNRVFANGPIAVVSRSGTLTYEVVDSLRRAGLGVSVCIGIGGDPVVGMTMEEAVGFASSLEATKALIAIGEIGGDAEEMLAEMAPSLGKPMVAYVAGQTAPKGKRMGHAGALVLGEKGTAKSKIDAFVRAGVPVAEAPWEIAELVKRTAQARGVNLE